MLQALQNLYFFIILNNFYRSGKHEYNRQVQQAPLSKTTDSRSFVTDDFMCSINVAFDLALFQSIALAILSQMK